MKPKDRLILFDKYNGKCAYCGCDLQKGWHADHIEAVIRNRVYNYDKRQWVFDGTFERPHNDCLSNMNPACAKCNINKRDMTIEGFRKSIKKFVESLNSYSVQYQMAKKYRLVKEQEIEVVFYYETIKL